MSGKRDLGLETHEVDGSVLIEAIERAGHEVGEASDDEVARILDDVETGDHTREIDVREVRRKHGGEST